MEPTGDLREDRVRGGARRLRAALRRPWPCGLSLHDARSDPCSVVEGPDHPALFAWSTGS
ncbi:MAG: hypothetical protein R3B09_30945 [Nannocystaceae bacterium]